MTIQFNFYLGTDTNGADVDAKQLALNLAAKYFPNGHTVSDTLGRWTGDVGVIDEATIVVTWITELAESSSKTTAKSFANEYKLQANQESVLITAQKIVACYV